MTMPESWWLRWRGHITPDEPPLVEPDATPLVELVETPPKPPSSELAL